MFSHSDASWWRGLCSGRSRRARRGQRWLCSLSVLALLLLLGRTAELYIPSSPRRRHVAECGAPGAAWVEEMHGLERGRGLRSLLPAPPPNGAQAGRWSRKSGGGLRMVLVLSDHKAGRWMHALLERWGRPPRGGFFLGLGDAMLGTAKAESFVWLLESGRIGYAGSNGGFGRALGPSRPHPYRVIKKLRVLCRRRAPS